VSSRHTLGYARPSGRNTLLSATIETIQLKKKLAEPRKLGCTTGQHMYHMLVLDAFSSVVSLLQGSRRWQMKDEGRFGAYTYVPLVHANTTILQRFQMCKNWEVIQCDGRVYIHQGYMGWQCMQLWSEGQFHYLLFTETVLKEELRAPHDCLRTYIRYRALSRRDPLCITHFPSLHVHVHVPCHVHDFRRSASRHQTVHPGILLMA
jgi:hypothetical protein